MAEYRLRDLHEVELPGWPDDYRQMNRIPEHMWNRGIAEESRRRDLILDLPFDCEHPLLGYCLGVPKVMGDVVELWYWLFPCTAPREQDQAVAALIVGAKLGGWKDSFTRVKCEHLLEDELSDVNRKEIKEAESHIARAKASPDVLQRRRPEASAPEKDRVGGDGRCPFCRGAIDPSDVRWRCQACGHETTHQNLLLNCDNCRFSPRTIACPHCHRSFEWFLLIGTFQGTPVEVVPAGEAIGKLDCTEYTIGSIPNMSWASETVADEQWSLEIVFKMLRTRFPFPIEPRYVHWYQAHRTDGGQHWLHGWLFDRDDIGFTDTHAGKVPTVEQRAQISVFYPTDGPSDESPTAGFRLTDVLVAKGVLVSRELGRRDAPGEGEAT